MYTNFLLEIKNGIYSLGIRNGDSVYVASDVTRILMHAKRKYKVQNINDRNEFLLGFIEVLKDIVGNQGNLFFPVFSWEFCRGKSFKRKSSLGEVGALNNWILKNCHDFKRTAHPIYSFMVWGKNADDIEKMDNIDAWGVDSPFAWLHRNNGKMLLLDVSLQRGFTFMHYVECCAKVPYRYVKNFRGEYIENDGNKSMRNYTMYVRDLDVISQEYLPDSFLETCGAMVGRSFDDYRIKVIDLTKAYDAVYDDLRYHGGEHCYHFKNYRIDWDKGATHENEFGNRLS